MKRHTRENKPTDPAQTAEQPRGLAQGKNDERGRDFIPGFGHGVRVERRPGGKDGEAAFLRVTGFYNRVGTLVSLRLVDGRAILRTIGGTAYAVWKKSSL